MIRADLMDQVQESYQMRTFFEIILVRHTAHDNSTNEFLSSKGFGPVAEEEFKSRLVDLEFRRLGGKVPDEHPKKTMILDRLEPGMMLCSLSSHIELREWVSIEEETPFSQRGHLALIHSTEERHLAFFPDDPEDAIVTVEFPDFISYIASSSNRIILPIGFDRILTITFPSSREATKFATSIIDYTFGHDSLTHFKGNCILEQMNKSTFFRSLDADPSLDRHVLRKVDKLEASGLSTEFPAVVEACPVNFLEDWVEELHKAIRCLEWKFSRLLGLKDERESLDPVVECLREDAELLYHIVPFCPCDEPTHSSVDLIMDKVIAIKAGVFLIGLHKKLHPILEACFELTSFVFDIRTLLPGYDQCDVKQEQHLKKLKMPKEVQKKFGKIRDNAITLKKQLQLYYDRRKNVPNLREFFVYLKDEAREILMTNSMLYVIEDIFKMTKKAIDGTLEETDFKDFDAVDREMRSGSETFLRRKTQQHLSELSLLKIVDRRPDELAKFCMGPEIDGVRDELGCHFVDSLTGRRSTSYAKIANQLAVFDINMDFIREMIGFFDLFVKHFLDLDEDLWTLCSKAVLELKPFAVSGETVHEVDVHSSFNLGSFPRVHDTDFVLNSNKSLGSGSFGRVERIQHKHWGPVTLKRSCGQTILASEEMRAVQELCQKNNHIVRVRGFYFPDKNHDVPEGYVMETGVICLHDFIYEKYGKVDHYKYILDWSTVLRIAEHLSAIFSDIHELGWIHRDIKPGNILLDEEGRPVICDFGLTHRKEESRDDSIGTPLYSAPELLNSSQTFDEKVDVFAFGIMLWEISHRRLPYSDMEFKSEYDRRQYVISDGRMEIGKNWEMEKNGNKHTGFLKELIEKCWSAKPEDRPTMREIEALLKNQRYIELFQKRAYMLEENMVHYKVTYFEGRGAGEIIRQCLVLAGQEFEDVRLSDSEWEKQKDGMPFRQLPVLEEDGKQLAQSYAAARYLARKYGFSGKTAWEEAHVDALVDQWKDFRKDIYPLLSVLLGYTDGNLELLKTEHLPNVRKNFTYFVNALKKSSSGFLAPSGLTYVDLPIAEFIQTVEEKYPEILKEFPELVEHKKKVQAVPAIKQWRETRPKSDW